MIVQVLFSLPFFWNPFFNRSFDVLFTLPNEFKKSEEEKEGEGKENSRNFKSFFFALLVNIPSRGAECYTRDISSICLW